MTWSKLKWTALFSMILGHIYAAVPVQTILLTYFKIEPDVSYPVVTALQCIGSIAFPIYAFGIAQGCIHTDNALFYCLRLLVFAIIAEVPYNLTLRYGFVKFAFNNILFTLLLGAVCCLLYDFIKKQIFSWAAWIPVLLLVFLAESFNRFLIISLDVLICRYSPLFRAFPALFISEEPHKSFYYPLCFRSQK